MLPEWAPNVHPLIVHFPIAILIIAFILDALAYLLPQKWWSNHTTATLYVVGALAAILTYFSGEWAADTVNVSGQAEAVLSHHADWAMYTVWFYGFYAFFRFSLTYMRDMFDRRLHIFFFALSFVGLFLLYETAEHGGELVYGHGVGVEAVEKAAPEEGESSPADTALAGSYQWLQGGPDSLSFNAEDDSLMRFSLMGSPVFFVGQKSYANQEIKATFYPMDYTGYIYLAVHVQDSLSYEYMSVGSDGSVDIGRVQDGENQIFEKGQVEPADTLRLRLVTTGDHYRAYVNGNLIIHIHEEALAAGKAGILLDGQGELRMTPFTVTELEGEEE